LAINILLILFLFGYVGTYLAKDWGQLSKLKVTLNFQAILLSFAYYGLNYILLSLSWHVLFKAFNAKVGWWDNLMFYSYSHLMRFLPTPVWFLTSRAVLYEQVGTRKRIAVLTTLLETLLHVISGLCFFCFLRIDFQKPLTVLFFLLSLAPAIFIILRPDVFQRQSVTGEQSLNGILRTKDVCLIFLLFTFTWLISAPFYSAVIRSVVPESPLLTKDLWNVWILSNLISYLSAYTLGGIGMLREFSMTLLLNKWFPPPIALLITVMVRILMTAAGVIWALIAMAVVKLIKFFGRLQPVSNQ